MGYTGRMGNARANGLRLRVFGAYEAMSRAAADLVCGELRRQPDLLLCVSAGATPARTYEILAARYCRQPKLFERMRVVQIDEWGGLAPRDPATCEMDLSHKVLDPLRVSRNRFKGLRTDATDLEAECDRMQGWLAANGPIDVCILGLGTNGHVGMNEPAEALAPRTHVATLAESSRGHGMLKDMAKKPRYGLTLGLADILGSRRVLLLVNGKRKRPAVRRLMRPEISTLFPASFLWLHPDATVLCDRDAAPDFPACC